MEQSNEMRGFFMNFKKIFKSILATLTCVSILIPQNIYAIEMDYNVTLYNADEKVQTYSNEGIQASFDDAGESLVIYGHDLDVEYYHSTFFDDSSILKLSSVSIPNVENKKTETTDGDVQTALTDIELINRPFDSSVDTSVENKETYAIVAYNNGNSVSLSYYSFSYTDSVTSSSDFYNLFLSNDNLQEIAAENSTKQGVLPRYAYNSVLVGTVRDNNTGVDTYITDYSNESFDMIMFEKDVIINAYKYPDANATTDAYYFIGQYTVTPGNDLPQNPLSSPYKNAIIVSGVQNDFWINESTGSEITDAYPLDLNTTSIKSSKTFTGTIQVIPNDVNSEVTISFNWNAQNNVTRSSMNDGVRYNNAYFGSQSTRKYCISTSSFNYEMVCSLNNVGNVMGMHLQNCVLTYFQNESTSERDWFVDYYYLTYTA